MAKLQYRGKATNDQQEIRATLSEFGVPYEHWGLRKTASVSDEEILQIYRPEIDRLMNERGYAAVDLVALHAETTNLEGILAKFTKEHHHTDDEVRFTVEGEGVFEIEATTNEFLKFTAEPGDLIVIPAGRRHSFYLTSRRQIRCIRLFQDKAGWEAIYDKPSVTVTNAAHDGKTL